MKALCLLVLLITLTAGLWPFHVPRNDVSWLSGENGLFLGKHGSLVSASPLSAADRTHASDSFSIEIWLKPNRTDAEGLGMILAFYSPASRLTTFSLRQFQGGLVMERESPYSVPQKTEIYVGEVFGGQRPVLVTITSGRSGTATYVDGVLKRAVPSFIVSSRDLMGQMVVGNSPLTSYSWSGQLKGLAIYDHELSSAEVAQSFAGWTRESHDAGTNEGVVARYVFDGLNGRVVRNQVDPATNLFIPERFFILNERFLERPWDEYQPGWRYWRNVLVNIVGLVPLGFFFYAYFSTIPKIRRAAWLTIVFGFAVSLTIEVLQSFLPTRDSGMTDLFTNTLGTALGVILCAWCVKRNWFDMLGISPVADLEKQRQDTCLVS